MNFLAIAAVVFFGSQVYCQGPTSNPVQSQPTLCQNDEYYSDIKGQCLKATLQIGDKEMVDSLGIDDLRAKYKIHEMTLFTNPAYKENGSIVKRRKYNGISLKEIVKKLLPKGDSLKDYVLAFTCLDGYDPVLKPELLSELENADALLAFEQTGIKNPINEVSKDSKWELVKAPWGIVSPGPFYLVWKNSEKTYPDGWPFEIKSMRLIKAKDYQEMLAKIEPPKELMGQKPKTNVEEGYGQARGKCIVCHSFNGIGGKKSPTDLVSLFKIFKDKDESLQFISDKVAHPPLGMSDIRDIKISPEDLAHINDYVWNLANSQ